MHGILIRLKNSESQILSDVREISNGMVYVWWWMNIPTDKNSLAKWADIILTDNFLFSNKNLFWDSILYHYYDDQRILNDAAIKYYKNRKKKWISFILSKMYFISFYLRIYDLHKQLILSFFSLLLFTLVHSSISHICWWIILEMKKNWFML